MIELIKQQLAMVFGDLSLGDIDQHVDRTNQLARAIPQWRGIGEKRHAGSVRALGYRFGALNGAVFGKRHRHRAILVTHWCAVWPIQPPGHAPLIAPDHRYTPGQLDTSLVEIADLAIRIGGVNGCGQGFQKIAQALFCFSVSGLQLLAFGDVAGNCQLHVTAAGSVAAVWHRHGHRVGFHVTSFPGEIDDVEFPAEFLAVANAQMLLLPRRAVLRRNELEYAATLYVLWSICCQHLQASGVHLDQRPVAINHLHALGRVVHHRAQPIDVTPPVST